MGNHKNDSFKDIILQVKSNNAADRREIFISRDFGFKLAYKDRDFNVSPIDLTGAIEAVEASLVETEMSLDSLNDDVVEIEETLTGVKTTSSMQWSKTLPGSSPLSNGDVQNLLTFLSNSDTIPGGTTDHGKFLFNWGLDLAFTGTSGTADVVIAGDTYIATFDTDISTTINNFITDNKTAIEDSGLFMFPLGDNIRLDCEFEDSLNNISITNTSGNLAATKINSFTNNAVASRDHIKIPYVGEPYEGSRIIHALRASFNIATGSIQYSGVGLYRYSDDSLIGSVLMIVRNQDITGGLYVIDTYTDGASDPFVEGGFYVAVENVSGVTLTFEGNVGILLQSFYEKLIDFNL